MFEDTFIEQEREARKEQQVIPEYLIYEMDEGKPIYYRGYKEVLAGTKTFEEIMGSSILHAVLVNLISQYFNNILNGKYAALTGEMGLQLKYKSHRALDIGIYEKKELLKNREAIVDKYASFSPKYIIEIDTKAAFDENNKPPEYYFRKTQQLLDFGAEKVIWFYTNDEKFMLAEKGKKRWEIGDWSENIFVEEGVVLNVGNLIDSFYGE